VALLVRHGLTPTTGTEMPYPGPGPSLTEQGRRQVEDAGQHILELRPSLPPITALYSSPLTRTKETAAILGKALDLAPLERVALRDCEMGEWAGTPLKDLVKKPEWSTVLHYPSQFTFPGGETLRGMQFRVVEAVSEVVAAHEGRTVVVVSHADPIKAVLAEVMGIHLDLFQRILVSPASVSAIAFRTGGPSVMFTNWVSSLPALSERQAKGPARPGTAR